MASKSDTLYFYISIGLVLMSVSWPYAYNSVALIVLGLVFFISLAQANWKFAVNQMTKLEVSIMLFGVWQLLSFLWTADLDAARAGIGLKCLFIGAPLIFSQVAPAGTYAQKIASGLMVLGVISTDLYALIQAAIHFNRYLDPDIFLYHRLSQPIGLNAIYLSLINGIGIFMLCLTNTFRNFWFRWVPAIVMIVVLLLLQSKMILSVLLLLAVIGIIRKLWGKDGNKKLYAMAAFTLLVASLLLVSKSSRFEESMKSEILKPLKADDLSGLRVDGVSIRVFQYRVFYEIMRDDPIRLLGGFGLKGQQKALDAKYIEYNLYTGNDKESGLLGLSIHNQYLYTCMTSGIVGLTLLLHVLWRLFQSARPVQTNIFLWATTLFFVATFFSEMIIERHRGGVLFLFVVLFYQNKSGQ